MTLAPPLILPDEFNAAVYFIDRHIAEGRGAKVAIECGDIQLTYRELFERVNQVGNGLRSLGVRIEERVFLLLLDTPEFAISFFGAIKIGAVPVPVNTLLKPADYLYLLNNSRARVAIVSESLRSLIDATPRHQLRYLETIVVIGDGPGAGPVTFAELTQKSSATLDPEPTCKDDAAFWLYSSGSTGAPKACVHLHHDMVICAELFAKGVLGIGSADRCFSVAKLFFAYGLGNGLYFPLSVGATSVLWPGAPTAANVYAVIERHRPTLLFSVPTGYGMLLAHPEGRRDGGPACDLSSVRLAVSAGEALPPALYERFKRRFGIDI